MEIYISDVQISFLNEESELSKETASPTCIYISDEQENLLINTNDISGHKQIKVKVNKSTDCARFGKKAFLIADNECGYIFRFETVHSLKFFSKIINDFKNGNKSSVFSQRTDDSSASQYFQFYGYLSQQQNMMQDYIRTSTYQKAIISNTLDFRNKIVLDVGAGSGILSFFAVQAGARKVYAVEASSMAKHAERLVEHNKLSDRILVIPGKIEEIDLPEKVDVIISEPMGYMLFNERMLETYLHAKKFLKPNGKMFPTRGDLHIAPFSDYLLFMEQLGKANFWCQSSFHGVNLFVLRDAAIKEYFKQPIVDTFDINICMAKSHSYKVDFLTAQESDLHHIDIPVNFVMQQNGEIHGLAFWFDVGFLGSEKVVWLSTNPTQPLTHWYQIRCLIETPIFVYKGQVITGRVQLISNKRQSYDVEIELTSPTGQKSTNFLDLKNPFFRYNGQPTQPPTGTYEQSPSEQLAANFGNPYMNIHQQQVTSMNNMTNNMTNGYSSNENEDSLSLMLSAVRGFPPENNNSLAQCSQNALMNCNNLTSPGSGNRSNKGLTNGNMNNIMQSPMPPSSIGGGISPLIFNPILNTSSFPVSNNLMIGDYVTPGNLATPNQNSISFK